MPNWKKLIVSGSDAELNSLNVTSTFTASGINYPPTDGDNGDTLITDGAGNLSFARTTVYANVKNVHGSELVKGMPVHVTGAAGNTSEVVAASASNAATMPAHFILNETLADDAEGLAIAVGYINQVNTGDFSEGDTVYVGANGGYTNVKPTGSNLIQNLGIVDKVDASNGSGFILGAGRSNDVPNITSGYAWVGNSDSVATAVATSSFVVTNANTASYVAAANIDGTIDISDQTNLAGGTNLTLSGDTMNLDANISLTSIIASSEITTAGSLITTKTGSVTDPALLIGANSGYVAGNNTGIILEELVPGTTFFVPYFVSNGAKIFGFGTVMQMEKNLDMQSNRIYFDSDSTNTYIASNADDPEDLEIHADQDVILNPDGQVIANSNISSSGTLTANTIEVNTDIDITTNNEFLRGKLTGGATRNLIGINSSNIVEVGNTTSPSIQLNNDTSIEGNLEVTGSITLEGLNVIDEAKFKVGETAATAGDGNGIIIKEGSTVTTAGKIYYYTNLGEWTLTDADAEASATGLLGVALGDNSGTKGMLLQGCVTLATDPGTTGDILYLQTDTAGDTGDATSTAPSGTNDIVRIIGYCINNAKIYFNPSNDFIKHT